MNDELTDDELELIEARAERATVGPWRAFVEGRDHTSGDTFIQTGATDDESSDMYVKFSFAGGSRPAGSDDLDFIAASRQDVVRLVREVRRLRALVG
ncbi:MAG: hypothetical protein ABL953_02350 [Ilumatobacteraceae bacterium]